MPTSIGAALATTLALVLVVPAGVFAKASHKGWPKIDYFWKNASDRDMTKHGTRRNDELLGGHGNDRLLGKADGDVLWGDYKPYGNEGIQYDRLRGGAGHDFIYTSHWHNVVRGGRGSDVIHAFYGHGTIDCGPGRDALYLPRTRGAYRIRNCEWKRRRTGESAPRWWLRAH